MCVQYTHKVGGKYYLYPSVCEREGVREGVCVRHRSVATQIVCKIATVNHIRVYIFYYVWASPVISPEID